VSPSPARAITIDLDLPAVNVTPCNVTCEENFYLNLPNGDVGYGLAMGTDHTFANDATHGASAILSGRMNALVASNGSVVVGGQNNTISGTAWSLIGAGHDNQVTAARSAVVAGGFNVVDSSLSFVGAGENNLILSLYEANAIVTGDSNEALNCTRSIIGAGFDNVMRDSDDCAVVSGKQNQILDSVSSIVGAGADNAIDNCVASSILSGHNNTIAASSHSTIGGGESNLVNDTTGSVISAGFDNEISGSSYHSGIVTGSTCSITASNTSLIGAGAGNSLDLCTNCFLGGGSANAITTCASCSLDAGRDNTIIDCNRSGIVAGDANTIEETYNAFVGTGIANYIYRSPHSAIVAGNANVIDSNITVGSGANFIGAGSANEITRVGIGIYDVQYNFIGAGSSVIRDSQIASIAAGSANIINVSSTCGVVACSQVLIENQLYSIVGAGALNEIVAVTQGTGNAIVAGSANAITGDIDYSLVGAGNNNIIRALSGSTSRALIGCGTDNIITDSWRAGIVVGSGSAIQDSNDTFIGAGTDHVIDVGSNSAAIVAGVGNIITNSTKTAIVAGEGNEVTDSENSFMGSGTLSNINLSPNSAIVAGFSNTIDAGVGIGVGANFIGASYGSDILRVGIGVYTVDFNFIGAGIGTILDSTGSFVGAGFGNTVNVSAESAIVAGDSNLIQNQVYAFIGAGELNTMVADVEGIYNAIVTGQENLITGDVTGGFIGAGNLNEIRVLAGTTAHSFIGNGVDNLITDSTRVGITVGRSARITTSVDSSIVNGNSSTITDSRHSLIGAGYQCQITNSDGAFTTGFDNDVINADYAFILGGTGVFASGALDASTGHMRHARVMETFRTPGIEVISGDVTVALGDHLFLANGVAATLSLGVAAATPDGMQIRVRDVGDVSMANIVLSCVVSGCTICPPGGACVSGGGAIDTMNVQYETRFYVYRASVDTWYAY